MAKNANLTAAKKAKNDEFYTQITDIEKELVHYHDQLRGKIVFCNCDDPTYSNFWRYFHLNFGKIGLKKLISTHFDPEKPTYKLEYVGGADSDWSVGTKTVLNENGDFRSPECVELLKSCDVVVTNPPFSLAAEYIYALSQSGKKFIIINTLNSVKYKNVFPLLMQDQMWIGYTSPKKFLQPDGTSKQFGNVLWYTNIDIKKRHEPLILFRRYYDDPGKYPKYENYDAINVCKISDIPCDYYGVMGVPITFLEQYCPDQFEILGASVLRETMPVPVQLGKRFVSVYKSQGGTGHFSENMYGFWCFDENGMAKVPYSRILIRRKTICASI